MACVIAPAIVDGAVAPAIPADKSKTGMPPRIQFSITSQDSVANFIGGTTKQLEFDTNGRSRYAASLPAISYSISKAPATKSGSVKLVPICLVVPEQAA